MIYARIYNWEEQRERERIVFKFSKCLEWYKNIISACFGGTILCVYFRFRLSRFCDVLSSSPFDYHHYYWCCVGLRDQRGALRFFSIIILNESGEATKRRDTWSIAQKFRTRNYEEILIYFANFVYIVVCLRLQSAFIDQHLAFRVFVKTDSICEMNQK